jgi:hypothetical protein
VLATSDKIEFYSNAALTAVTLPAWTTGTELYANTNADVVTVSAANLVTLGTLDLEYSPALKSFSFPSLTSLGTLILYNDPVLPSCLLDGLRNQLGPSGAPYKTTVSGLDDTTLCN